ncbi:MAG: hypothetical protein IJZ35_02460 [Clostridia bacterium]|nr:hypothetical protein [Clostridia bacterium]
MNEFWLYPEDDEEIFFEICKDFETQYPQFQKTRLLRDVDDSLVQPYAFKNKEVIIILERCWFYEIMARTNIDLTEFSDNWNKKYKER